MSAIAKPVHILVYPFPTSGHIIPLLDFTHRLLTRGLTITILITPNNLSLLDSLLLSFTSSLQPLLFPSPQNPTINNANGRFNMHTALRQLHYPLLLQWFRSHQSPPPAAIISDFFLGWTQQLAYEVGVPRVVFSPSGAFGLSMFFTLWKDLPKMDDPDDANSLMKIPNLPNSPVFPLYQLPPLYTMGKEGDPVWEFHRDSGLGNIDSWGIVLNTSTELERLYLQHLKKQVGHDRVWAVGPVLPLYDDVAGGSAHRGGSSSVPCHHLLAWLDAREEGSVVYVCFGSRGALTRKIMDTLAAALEESGVHFIWCSKQPDERPRQRHVGREYGDVPEGFNDRVAGKGYIIKGWAPQVEILRHRAVGAFLTHCGWNSTLEGMSAGVVLLTWPMGAEQFMNVRVLGQLGMGITVGEGTQRIPEPTELARLFVESVKRSTPQKVKAKELRDALSAAVAKGGSSDRELEEFVRSLNEPQPQIKSHQNSRICN